MKITTYLILLFSFLYSFEVIPLRKVIILDKGLFSIYYSCYEKKPLFTKELLLKKNILKPKKSIKGLYFYIDKNLSKSCRSYIKDYKNSKYIKGKNVSYLNYKYNKKLMFKTFSMSTISPETRSLRKILYLINDYARKIFIFDKKNIYTKLYIYTGSFGVKEYLNNHVVVPKYWFKIIYSDKTNQHLIFLIENKNYNIKHFYNRDIFQFLIDKKKFNRTAINYIKLK